MSEAIITQLGWMGRPLMEADVILSCGAGYYQSTGEDDGYSFPKWLFKETQREIGLDPSKFLYLERTAELTRQEEANRAGKEWRAIPPPPRPPGILSRLW